MQERSSSAAPPPGAARRSGSAPPLGLSSGRRCTGPKAATPGVPITSSLRLTPILPIIPLLHNVFPGARLSCRCPFIASLSGWGAAGLFHITSSKHAHRCSLVAPSEENLGEASLSQVNGRGIGLPSCVRVIVTETTPDKGRKINETERVWVKMHRL